MTLTRPSRPIMRCRDRRPDTSNRVERGHRDATASNELYVSFGDTPSRSQADFTGQPAAIAGPDDHDPRDSGRHLLHPGLRRQPADCEREPDPDGLDHPVRGHSGDPDERSATPDLRRSRYKGALFDRATTFTSGRTDRPDHTRRANNVQDAATAYVTFDLTDVSIGGYTVVATSSTGGTAQLTGGLAVVTGEGGELQTSLTGPSFVLVGRNGVFEVNYANAGDADIGAPSYLGYEPLKFTDQLDVGLHWFRRRAFFPRGQLNRSGWYPARQGAADSMPVYFQAPSTAGIPMISSIKSSPAATLIHWIGPRCRTRSMASRSSLRIGRPLSRPYSK